MTDTSASTLAYADGLLGDPIEGELQLDGSILYNGRTAWSDIRLYGASIKQLLPEACQIWPSGQGWVLVQKLEIDEERYQYPDGRYRNYTLYGKIEIY
jgi:hypothetical protein